MPKFKPKAIPQPAPDPPPAFVEGIICHVCGCKHFSVIRTWHLVDGRIRRRRCCRTCGRVLVSTERLGG